MSHELRTPLNAITGWLSMLRRPEVMSSTSTSKAWAAIDRSTHALTGLIEDLIDLSRIATGRIRLAETDVDINEVVAVHIAQETARPVRPVSETANERAEGPLQRERDPRLEEQSGGVRQNRSADGASVKRFAPKPVADAQDSAFFRRTFADL